MASTCTCLTVGNRIYCNYNMMLKVKVWGYNLTRHQTVHVFVDWINSGAYPVFTGAC